MVVQLTAKGKERERRAFEPVLKESLKMLAGYLPEELMLIADFLQKGTAMADRVVARMTAPAPAAPWAQRGR